MTERYDEIGELAAFAEHVTAGDEDPVVVIAGCGKGETVENVRARGVTAYGFDTSGSMLETVEAPTREFLLEADLRDKDLVETLCETFEIDKIDVFLTECMLSFLSVEEAGEALRRIRTAPEVGVLLHKIRLDPPVQAQERMIDATILSPTEWQEACDPDGADIWRDAIERWDLPPR